MDFNNSPRSRNQVLLGVGAALLISAGPNLWLARKRADAEAARQKVTAQEEPAPVLAQERPASAIVSTPAASAADKEPSSAPPDESKELSALFTAEMQTMMEGWSEWRGWWEASYLKLVTGAPAPVVDAWQTWNTDRLNPKNEVPGEKEKSSEEKRKEEEDWLRQNLTPAQWAAWEKDLASRKAADLEAMAEEMLYSVSQHISLTPEKKEALYAMAVAGSEKAFDEKWSRNVQMGIGISTNEPVQPEKWADDLIQGVLTPEQWQVWEPATMHTRNLPDQLTAGMAARLVEAVRQHGLADVLGEKFKEMAAEAEEFIETQEAGKTTPEALESK